MIRTHGRAVALSILLAVTIASVAHAQGRGGPNWTTTGGDAQRTSSVKTDPRISRESLQKPGFQLLWKSKLENQPRQLESLTQPMLLSNIISYKGFKALAFVGGSSDNVYSIDYDLNKLFWKRHLNTLPPAAGSLSCPGAMTTITRATPLGAATPAAPVAPGAPPGPRGGNTNVYAISSGGQLHTLNPQTGDDLTPPVKFLPPNAKAVGAVLIDQTLYVSTRDGCGSAPNGVYALDLSSNPKQVTQWEAKGANVVGAAGPTFGTDGNMFVATDGGAAANSNDANAVVALDRQTLKPKDWFSPGTAFAASPVAFQYKGKHLIVAANTDGRLLRAGCRVAWWRRSSNTVVCERGVFDACGLCSRRAGDGGSGGRLEMDLCRGRPATRRRHDSVDQRRRDERRDRRLQDDRSGWRADAAAGVDLARHGVADAAHHRQWRRLCDLERRVSISRRADDCGAAGSAFKARCSVRLGRGDGQRVVVERYGDRIVCPGRGAVGRRRTGLRGDI